ncbi:MULTISPECIES: hypothetical protein [unclassified Oceanispirochaeta]|uniref:hypothetical protein n=1 Tax=unclassified Oceanispirochaeta TaxID=2635722 RepID=UPI0011C07773|nr:MULTISPECIES: hypothetical protein [unclassified Oceanispirochaeta]MBF9014152.1 hypothetical protein [Oceanispirochaeta sp. M2]NPD70642.1 hypothetical protein [Oceanispirochaeta sp. M1]
MPNCEDEVSKLDKKMCKLAKEGLKKKQESEIFAEVLSPRFICKKCLRVSTDKDLLCDPKKLV